MTRKRATFAMHEEHDKAIEREALAGEIIDSDCPTAQEWEIYIAFVEGSRTQTELAEDYATDRWTIAKKIERVERWQQTKFATDHRRTRARAVERLELIYAKAMQAYERSTEDGVETSITSGKRNLGSGSGQSGDQVVEKRWGQAGSAALLAQAREAVMAIVTVLGAQQAKQVKAEIHSALRVGGKDPAIALTERMTLMQQVHDKLRSATNAN